MSSPRSSVLVPLSKKNLPRPVSNSNLLNPKTTTALSKTPSPKATPMKTSSLASLKPRKLSNLSPAPSPSRVSSSLVNSKAVPLINVGPSPVASPSPRLVKLSPRPVKLPSPRPVQSSLPKLSPSPRPLKLSPTPRKLSPVPRKLSPSPRPLKLSPSPRPLKLSPSPKKLSPAPVRASQSSLPKLSPSPKKLSPRPLSSAPRSVKLSPSPRKLSPSPRKLSLTKLAGLDDATEASLKPLSNKPTQVDSMAESTLVFEDTDGEIGDISLEKELFNQGYLPVDKILTKDGNGNLMCKYIKAVDKTGRTAYVDLDCEGFVGIDDTDSVIRRTESEAVVAPYSTKIGTYECASSDVCGVAFECDNQVCVMKRKDEDLTPTETYFVEDVDPASSNHKKHGTTTNHPIPYPIVSMTDIRTHPHKVACSIRNSHQKMRHESFRAVEKNTSNLKSSLNDLKREIDRFEQNHKVVSKKLNKTIKKLEEIHATYEVDPPVTDAHKQNLKKIHYNLRKRHDMTVDHLKLSKTVTNKVEEVKRLIEEIRELNDLSVNLFRGLDGVYEA